MDETEYRAGRERLRADLQSCRDKLANLTARERRVDREESPTGCTDHETLRADRRAAQHHREHREPSRSSLFDCFMLRHKRIMVHIPTNLSNPQTCSAPVGVSLMIGENKERWRELCEQVAVEQDPKKLVELTTEIYRVLEEMRRRLQRRRLLDATPPKTSN